MWLYPGTQTTVSEVQPFLLLASVGISLGRRSSTIPAHMGCPRHGGALILFHSWPGTAGQLQGPKFWGRVTGPLLPSLHRRLEGPVDHVARPEGSQEAAEGWGGCLGLCPHARHRLTVYTPWRIQ